MNTNTTNIQSAQMDIIRQVLNVSDIKMLDRIKSFLRNNKESFASNVSKNQITAELQKEINDARQEYKRGETLHFESAADAKKWMESL